MMKRKNIVGLCGAALVTAGLFTAAVNAGAHGSEYGNWRGGCRGAQHMEERMIKNLDLNEEQQVLLRAQRDARTMAGENPRHRVHEQLHGLITADNFDEQQLEELATNMAEKMKATMVNRAKAMRELYVTLSDEQKQKLAQMHKKRRKHMKAYRGEED